MGLAVITAAGNLGADPEINKTRNGEVMSFSLAVNTWRQGEEVTDWYRCVTFYDGMIDRIEKLKLGRGSNITVTGKLQQAPWEDRDGNKRVTMEILLADFHPGGAPPASGGRERPDDRGGRGGRGDERGGRADDRGARSGGRGDERGGRGDTRGAVRDEGRAPSRGETRGGRADDRGGRSPQLDRDLDDEIPF